MIWFSDGMILEKSKRREYMEICSLKEVIARVTVNKKKKGGISSKMNTTWLLLIMFMIGLGLFLLIIRTFIPAAGRLCLVNDFVDMLMFLDLAFLFFLCGFLLIKAHTFTSMIEGVVLGLLGIACIWGVLDNSKVISDIGTEPQVIVLDDCQCDYRIRKAGKSTYRLSGISDGKTYTFDVGGFDKKMLTELGENHGSAIVTYYKNSMSVVSVK